MIIFSLPNEEVDDDIICIYININIKHKINSMIRYPKHFYPGATIAVTAPSGGVRENWRVKFDRTLQDLRDNGYKVIEGQCLYSHIKNVSAPAQERASELMSFLCDATIDAIFPPCGGDLAIELLPLLDFDK